MKFIPDIIYEDNHLLVIIKPQNMPVQEDESEDMDLLRGIKQYIKERDNKPGNVFLGLVHRLDRPTGGVMVFAKTTKCASRLTEQLKSHEMKKSYLCVALGNFSQPSGRLSCYLVKDNKNNIVNLATKSDYGAKEAILDYELLESKQNMNLVKVDLITGRSHQIRVQMSYHGYPIYGDMKYGIDNEKIQIHLWCYHLKFKHPTKDQIMEFNYYPKWFNN